MCVGVAVDADGCRAPYTFLTQVGLCALPYITYYAPSMHYCHHYCLVLICTNYANRLTDRLPVCETTFPLQLCVAMLCLSVPCVCVTRELGLICHEPTRMEVAAERSLLTALLLSPEEEQQQDSEADDGSSSSSSAKGPSSSSSGSPPPTTPSLKGISSVTGLPLLPSFAVACHAGFDPHEGLLKLEGLVASEDGRTLHRLEATQV